MSNNSRGLASLPCGSDMVGARWQRLRWLKSLQVMTNVFELAIVFGQKRWFPCPRDESKAKTRGLGGPARSPQFVFLFYAFSGDQAGSDASVGVGTCRSLKPVMSMETSRDEKPWPYSSWLRVSRQNISTRPFGAKVGPSTE